MCRKLKTVCCHGCLHEAQEAHKAHEVHEVHEAHEVHEVHEAHEAHEAHEVCVCVTDTRVRAYSIAGNSPE